MLVLRCAYFGAKYHGFQIQPDVPTIQGEIINSLIKIGIKHNIRYASRTDAGVSAVDQILLVNISDPSVVQLLNQNLPNEIKIHSFSLLNNFSFSQILYKEYLYVAPKFIVDINVLNKAIEFMNGIRLNYIHLIKKPSQVSLSDVLMRIHINIKKDQSNLYFYVKSKKFLWEQVRRLVNCLLAVGLGRISLDTFKLILHGKPYPSGIPPAPPEGLILWRTKTPVDDKFIELTPRRKIEEWVLSSVKRAIMSSKWTLPPIDRRLKSSYFRNQIL